MNDISRIELLGTRSFLQRPHEYQKKLYKKVVRYKECLKNHAAAIGGNATDGCGEFMPSGEAGSLELLKCKACNCHRNFHRKVVYSCDDECSSNDCHHSSIFSNIHARTRLILGYPSNSLISSKGKNPQKTVFHENCSLVSSESEQTQDGANGEGMVVAITRPIDKVKKRLRTKFTEAQKEKMLSFAEKAGWKLQKLEESVVEGFCQEIGIERRVLRVWMYNNKHSFAKKSPQPL
ncbi:hypothetical protein K2173_011963 [Erythroxylum novogranatense]|uniref:ZF-HD dimerization-type domain-containing protein n=1 Tax=Erythroxylum novogranatense TaxID=1862640 RepID=A0AAV8TEF2_9ROSI|nr:hypothetical protein K2173_011963 [Erythroxylum novogranatense]